MEFSKDQADFIKGYFLNFDDWEKYGARRNNFSYTEFPVKSMIEAAIGEAILHSLDSQFGNFLIFHEDCNGDKTSPYYEEKYSKDLFYFICNKARKTVALHYDWEQGQANQ